MKEKKRRTDRFVSTPPSDRSCEGEQKHEDVTTNEHQSAMFPFFFYAMLYLTDTGRSLRDAEILFYKILHKFYIFIYIFYYTQLFYYHGG